MPIVSINGVALPVLIESMTVDQEMVGTQARNARGWRVLDRRATKRTLAFALAPRALDEAMMYRSLILGDGEHWALNSSAYGDRGLPITGTGAVTASVVDPYGITGGLQLAQTGTQTMILPNVGPDQSAVARAINAGGTKVAGKAGTTLIGWRGVGTAGAAVGAWRAFGWSWRAYEVPTVKRESIGALGASGALAAYTGGETFSTSGGILTVTMGGLSAGQAGSFFSLWALPWYLPQAQVDTLIAGLTSLWSPQPQLPGLFVQTDLIPGTQLDTLTAAGESTIVCHGEIKSMAVRPATIGGTFTTTAMGMSASLIEV